MRANRGPRKRRVHLPDEVVDLLREDPDLLAVADAIRSTRSHVSHRQRLGAFGIAAVAVVSAAVVVIVAPWSQHSNRLVDQAAADVLRTHVVHLRVRTQHPVRLGVDPETGKVLRAAVEVATTFDARTHKGRAIATVIGQPEAGAIGQVDRLKVAVGRFPSAYREALKMKRAVVFGESKTLVWVRITTPVGKTYDVALDRRTLQPVILRLEVSPNKGLVTLNVVNFSTK